MGITPAGITRIRPEHKAPYFTRPFRSFFFSAFVIPAKTPSVRSVFASFLEAIEGGRGAPFFAREEIDQLFEAAVLLEYAKGADGHSRYHPTTGKKLDNIAAWDDLINNKLWLINIRYYLISRKSTVRQDIGTHINRYQHGLRILKIIEDWLYWHPEVMRGVLRKRSHA